MKASAGADRGHDQDRRYRARNPVPLEKTGGGRQHGADNESHHDGEEECLGGPENGDHSNHQQGDQREGDHLGAPDNRGQFGVAVGQRCAHHFARTLASTLFWTIF